MKILTFGNPLLKQDSLPLKLLPTLKQKFPNIDFQEIDPTEDLEKYGPHLTILDTVQNITEVKTLTLKTKEDFKKLILPTSLTMHDFDLAYNLRLLKKLKLINQVKIICVPMNITEEKALKEISKILTLYPQVHQKRTE